VPPQSLLSYTVSPELLARHEFQSACRARDFGAMFKLMRKYDGASQDRIASPVEGLTQSRVSKIVRGEDHIASFEVIERVADALRIPGNYLGLATRGWEDARIPLESEPVSQRPTVAEIAPAPIEEPPAPPVQGAIEPGGVIDRLVALDIDIADDGWSTLTYRHELYNNSDTPFTRLSRELWFEHTSGPLNLQALPTGDDRNVIIQRIHETTAYTKFACQLFPALMPGESTTIAYTCTGGRFVSDHYWRQSIHRPTEELVLRLRHRGIDSLTRCSAIEERPDGSEISVAENLVWRTKDDAVTIELARRDLRPNQSVTLRWDVPRVLA
jgi:transcriptional regulator with XRE-family HTH domain